MSVEFNVEVCQTQSNKKRFGLCDDPAPKKNHAYIDELDGKKWIAVVDNQFIYAVTFTAIDNCIMINREDGNPAKRCDGVLTFNNSVIFVELKVNAPKGNDWVKEAEIQLRTSISYFEKTDEAQGFKIKMAYAANRAHPKLKESQIRRMNQFLKDTGYVLRIEARIILN